MVKKSKNTYRKKNKIKSLSESHPDLSEKKKKKRRQI